MPAGGGVASILDVDVPAQIHRRPNLKEESAEKRPCELGFNLRFSLASSAHKDFFRETHQSRLF